MGTNVMSGDVLKFLEATTRTINVGFVLDDTQAKYIGRMFGVDGPPLALGMMWRFATSLPVGQA